MVNPKPYKKSKGIVVRRRPKVKKTGETCPLSNNPDAKKRYTFVLPIDLFYQVCLATEANKEGVNALVERAIRAELQLAPAPPPPKPSVVNDSFLCELSKVQWENVLKKEENKK